MATRKTGLTRMRRRLGMFSGARRKVALNDARSPMLRLLQDCTNDKTGMVCVDYDQQWRTLFKAERLGYVDSDQFITAKGKAFVANGG